ncbi:MAG: hypothetical protein ABSE56_02340 [Bryobacteraceae bacterium]|jgi:hypothetical protein
MRTIAIIGLLALVSAFGQTTRSEGRDWTLPSSLAVKQDGPQSWRFTCDYYNLDTKGHLGSRVRYSALYTRGLPRDAVRWSDVTVAQNTDGSEKFPTPQKREFMEGFSYARSSDMLKPDFFRGFPPMAMQERDLVWDTEMIEGFGQTQFENLKLNTPYHVPDVADIALAGMGSFHHKDLQLIWTGISKRNGQECAVIDYRAFFNQLEISNPAVTLTGRSHYWGQIWVSLTTKRIEYATLYEDVLGEMKLQSQEKPMTISVFRIGTLEPAGK